jgi:hypothetical protein
MTMNDAKQILYVRRLYGYELTTATHSERQLNVLFFAALDAGLNPLLEHRRGQSRLLCLCTAEQWAAINGEGK